MKTTKMITAVLAVFLVAALFIGAASAAIAGAETVFVYQNGTAYTGTWYLSSDNSKTITFDSNGMLTGDNIVEGTYTNGTTGSAVVVKYPTATISVTLTGSTASVIGGTVAQASSLNFSTTMLNNVNVSGLLFTTPAGGQTTMFAGRDFSVMNSSDNVPLTTVGSGLWTVQAQFKKDDSALVNLSSTTPAKYLVGQDTFSFTVSSTTNAVSVDKDSVVKGNDFLLTVSGTPGQNVSLSTTLAGISAIAGQSDVSTADLSLGGYNVTIGDSGKKVIEFTTTVDDSFTITALFENGDSKTVKVTVVKGSVTATSAQESYFVGNELSFSGTNTETDTIALYIKGTNYAWQKIPNSNATVNSDDTWSKKVALNTLDAGTYSVYAVAISSSAVPANETDVTNNFAYDTVVLTLKQPFLSATADSSSVAKGDKIVISGTAEATTSLKYYVFGTNKFTIGSISVDDDASFSVKIPTTGFDAGQYYVVIQHPMYDTYFNVIGNQTNGNVYLNYSGTPTNMTTGVADGNTTVIFNAKERQSSNAAQALKDALDTQNIDDIYVALTFIVSTPYITLDSVADQSKGSVFTVKGTTNVVAGEVVTVEVISTAFTAVDKSSVSASSYLVVSTKVIAGTNGVNTWEVTFDTTPLDVDSYTIKAEISSKSLATSTTFKIIEATPTKTATTTATATKTATATATPTPQSPGFGAFLALAGLGAVAVLVLRRN